MNKKTYTTPKLTNHGDVEVLTRGSSDGDFTDKDFPVKTPKKDLTFTS